MNSPTSSDFPMYKTNVVSCAVCATFSPQDPWVQESTSCGGQIRQPANRDKTCGHRPAAQHLPDAGLESPHTRIESCSNIKCDYAVLYWKIGRSFQPSAHFPSFLSLNSVSHLSSHLSGVFKRHTLKLSIPLRSWYLHINSLLQLKKMKTILT